MPGETKYIARRSGPFAALMQATELAGLRLEVLPPVSLRDAYFDTVAGDLLRQGYVLRVREQGRLASAQLRALRHDAAGTPGDADAALEPPLTGPTLPLLPDGPLRDAVDWLAGEAPLRALLRLRQYRSARVAYDGTRLVGVLSLDVVGYELPAGLHVANEVEVELAETGGADDLNRLDPVLRARGLEPTSRSKFERGVLRLQRGPEDPLLLLPDERAALDALMETPDPAIRRRARVILLASRGYRDETVSAKAGLSPSRVRHWVQRFREGRLDALGVPETPLEALASGEASDREAAPGSPRRPAFRISEVVSGGTPTPALFRAEHFSPDGPTGPPEEPEDGLTIEREREEPPAPTFTPRGDGASSGQSTEPFAVVRPTPVPEAPPAPEPATPEPVAPDVAFGEGGLPPSPVVSVGSWEVVEVTAPEAADVAAPEPDDPRTQGLPESVETLDDLLGLIETGSVHTPRLGAPEAPRAVGSGDEGPPATPSSFVWLDAPEGEDTPDAGEAADVEMDAPADVAEARMPVEVEAPVDEEAAPVVAVPGGGTPVIIELEPVAVEDETPALDFAAPASDEADAVVPETAERASGRVAKERPRFRPSDPILHASARALGYQHARFEEAAARVRDEAAPGDVRRALLAAHRVRLALETFEEFLPTQPVRRLHAGLAGVVRALDALSDHDAVASRLAEAHAAAETEEDRAALEAAIKALAERRTAAQARVAHRLSGALHAQWTRRLERLLALLAAQGEAGLLEGDFFPLPADDYVGDPGGRPQRVRLSHMLGSALWRRYEGLRAYERVVDEAGDDLLRPLGVGCAGLQFVLGLAAEAAPAAARHAARVLESVEANVAALHRARVAADVLLDLAAALPQPSVVEALGREERAAQAQAAGRVREAWASLAGEGLRGQLAAVSAAL